MSNMRFRHRKIYVGRSLWGVKFTKHWSKNCKTSAFSSVSFLAVCQSKVASSDQRAFLFAACNTPSNTLPHHPLGFHLKHTFHRFLSQLFTLIFLWQTNLFSSIFEMCLCENLCVSIFILSHRIRAKRQDQNIAFRILSVGRADLHLFNEKKLPKKLVIKGFLPPSL